jgi:hypothetical protein
MWEGKTVKNKETVYSFYNEYLYLIRMDRYAGIDNSLHVLGVEVAKAQHSNPCIFMKKL